MTTRFLFFVLVAMLSVCAQALTLRRDEWHRSDDSTRFESYDSTRHRVRPHDPNVGHYVEIDEDVLRRMFLGEARRGRTDDLLTVDLPMPDGTFETFALERAGVMHPLLAEQYADTIAEYKGVSVTGSGATVRLDYGNAGLRVQVLSARDGRWFIEPTKLARVGEYVSFYSREYKRSYGNPEFNCLLHDDVNKKSEARGHDNARSLTETGRRATPTGDVVRTYRLAVATSFEYSTYHGGTTADVLSAVVTTINRVTVIYEQDFAVSFELIPNQDLIIYTTSADPFSNNNADSALEQCQSTLDSVIGSANYDVGHVFTTGSGGLAILESYCNSTTKAMGTTGLSDPIGDSFDVDFVAHELGHQIGCEHTFSGAASSCNFNYSPIGSREPGAGSTIMGYAGICGNDNIQLRSDAYFHSVSIDEARAFVENGSGATCGTIMSTSAPPPTAEVLSPSGMFIPIDTPFMLEGRGTAGSGGALSYTWDSDSFAEQSSIVSPDTGQNARFRSYAPTSSPVQYFPPMSSLISGTPNLGDSGYQVGRTQDMRFIVRETPYGLASAKYTFTVHDSGVPFAVTYPARRQTVSVLSPTTVEWDVAGTNVAPISVSSIEMFFSSDNGETWSPMGTHPNTGSATVQLEAVNSLTSRFMLRSVGNIFFTISGVFAATDGSLTPFPTPLPTVPLARVCDSGGKYIAVSTGEFTSTFDPQVTVDDLGPVRGAEVTIAHSWVGDIVVSLSNDLGDSIVLLDPGVQCTTNDAVGGVQSALFFDDSRYPPFTCSGGSTIVGTFQPVEPFANLREGSLYTLNVEDRISLDGGEIGEWCLYFEYAQAPTPIPPTPSPTPSPTLDPRQPLAPTNLRQISATEHSVTFAWEDVNVDVNADAWVVHMREGHPGLIEFNGRDDWTSNWRLVEWRLGGQERSITISNLTYASTGVNIRVRAFSLNGDGFKSLPSFAVGFTDGQEPTDQPTRVRVIASTTTSLTFAWDHPVLAAPGEPDYYPAGSYKLRQQRQGEKFTKVVGGQRVASNEYTLTGLEPGTWYKLRVLSRNVHGVCNAQPLAQKWGRTD